VRLCTLRALGRLRVLGSAVHVDFIPLHLFGTMLVWNERETVHLVLALLLVRASARDFNFQWVTGLHSVK
jgi:hypothetical protein